MPDISIFKSCGACQGDGLVSENTTDPQGNPLPGIPVQCLACEGSGKATFASIDGSFIDKIDSIETKVNTANSNILAVDTNVKTAIETLDKVLETVTKILEIVEK